MIGVGGVAGAAGNFCGGVDPDDKYERDDAQRQMGVVEGEGNRDEIEGEGEVQCL